VQGGSIMSHKEAVMIKSPSPESGFNSVTSDPQTIASFQTLIDSVCPPASARLTPAISVQNQIPNGYDGRDFEPVPSLVASVVVHGAGHAAGRSELDVQETEFQLRDTPSGPELRTRRWTRHIGAGVLPVSRPETTSPQTERQRAESQLIAFLSKLRPAKQQ
jgi:hypothetical protein